MDSYWNTDVRKSWTPECDIPFLFIFQSTGLPYSTSRRNWDPGWVYVLLDLTIEIWNIFFHFLLSPQGLLKPLLLWFWRLWMVKWVRLNIYFRISIWCCLSDFLNSRCWILPTALFRNWCRRGIFCFFFLKIFNAIDI